MEPPPTTVRLPRWIAALSGYVEGFALFENSSSDFLSVTVPSELRDDDLTRTAAVDLLRYLADGTIPRVAVGDGHVYAAALDAAHDFLDMRVAVRPLTHAHYEQALRGLCGGQLHAEREGDERARLLWAVSAEHRQSFLDDPWWGCIPLDDAAKGKAWSDLVPPLPPSPPPPASVLWAFAPETVPAPTLRPPGPPLADDAPLKWFAHAPAGEGLPWLSHSRDGSGVVIAGGAAAALATGLCEFSDVDLFFVVPPEVVDRLAAAQELMRDCLRALWASGTVKKNGVEVAPHVVSVGVQAAGGVEVKVQLVARVFETPAQIVGGFDIDLSCFLYDGARLWAGHRAARALARGFLLVDPALSSSSYEYRLAKYARRFGVNVLVPGADAEALSVSELVTPVRGLPLTDDTCELDVRVTVMPCSLRHSFGIARLALLRAMHPRQQQQQQQASAYHSAAALAKSWRLHRQDPCMRALGRLRWVIDNPSTQNGGPGAAAAVVASKFTASFDSRQDVDWYAGLNALARKMAWWRGAADELRASLERDVRRRWLADVVDGVQQNDPNVAFGIVRQAVHAVLGGLLRGQHVSKATVVRRRYS